jgi:hypothetical protein
LNTPGEAALKYGSWGVSNPPPKMNINKKRYIKKGLE